MYAIMIVEDHDIIREELSRFFREKNGYAVHAVTEFKTVVA